MPIQEKGSVSRFLSNVWLNRIYLLLCFAASAALFFLSSTSFEYSYKAFLQGDGAYTFFDDFVPLPEKSGLVYKLACLVPLVALFCLSPAFSVVKAVLFALSAVFLFVTFESVTVIFGGLLAFCYPWKEARLVRRETVLFCIMLVALAGALRLEKMPNAAGTPLQPDAAQYVVMSQEQDSFYETAHREPLFPYVNRILSIFFPVPENVAEAGYDPVRYLTVFLSTLLVVMTYLIGQSFFTHQTAALAAFLLCINKPLIYRSIQGIREELLAVGIVFLLWLAFAWKPEGWLRRVQPFVLGVVNGLLILLRTVCIPLSATLFAVLWLGKRMSLKNVLIAGTVCLILFAPYIVYCWKTFGDPMYSGNYHLNRFYYQKITGQGNPDFLSMPYVTSNDLMFTINSWYETVWFIAYGSLDIVLGSYAMRIFYLPGTAFWVGCSLAGYILWMKNPVKRYFLLFILMMTWPMGFIVGMMKGTPIVFDWRIMTHLAPFMALAAGEGFFHLLGSIRNPENKNR